MTCKDYDDMFTSTQNMWSKVWDKFKAETLKER